MNSEPTQPESSPIAGVDTQLSRRGFFAKVTVISGAVVAFLVGLPVVGFVFAPLARTPPRVWRRVGKLSEFPMHDTVKVEFEDPSPLPWAGVTARTAAYVRRLGREEFEAFSVNCRHLGCPVRWVAGPELFMCPCHGGVYYKDGSVAAGPPPAPLARYRVRVHGGEVEIRTGPIPLTTMRMSV